MNNSLYVDEILIDLKKLPKTAKIVLVFGIAFAIMFLVGLIFAFTNTDEMMAFVFILCGSIFSLMFFGILLGKKIKSNKRMKNIDLNQLRNELMQGVVEFEGTKTYFTNNYMLSNYYYTFVIKYSDIAWVYKHDKTNQYGTVLGSDLMICLKNKKKEYTTFGEAFIEEILRHNPNVLVGYSFENKKIYKNICKDYKAGNVAVSDTVARNIEVVQSNLVAPPPPVPQPEPMINPVPSEPDFNKINNDVMPMPQGMHNTIQETNNITNDNNNQQGGNNLFF